jgi:hypothetical protein
MLDLLTFYQQLVLRPFFIGLLGEVLGMKRQTVLP